MTWNEFVSKFRSRFKEELQRKTSWGRKELETLVDSVCIEVLTELMDIISGQNTTCIYDVYVPPISETK